MKWIGQHIVDLIARFRNDVYLEDIDTGTIASGGNLGLDANNKIVKATETTGDLTSIVAGTGLSGTSLTGPIPTLNLALTELSTVTPTSGDFLATLDGSTPTHQNTTTDSLATLFAGTGLTASSAVISVDASQTQITAVGTITTGNWRASAITHAYIGADAIEGDNIADNQITVAKFRSTAIQTSGETFADNDTSLMTSAAIDDKINTKYSTSYIIFSALSTSSFGTNYVFSHAKGISEAVSNKDSNVDSAGDFGGITTEEGGSGTDATATVGSADLEQQIPIPETCKLMGFYATTTANNSSTNASHDTGVAIWHVPESGVDWGNSDDSTATLIHKSDSSRHAENTAHGGGNRKKVQMVKRMDGTVKNLAEGDILIPSIFGETADQQIMATITLVIATPIKTI